MSNKTVLREGFMQLLSKIKPERLIADQCRLRGNSLTIGEQHYALDNYDKIYLLGSGKAVIPMAKAMQEILHGLICDTTLVGPYPLDDTLENTSYTESSHPIPTEKSMHAAQSLRNKLESLFENDLFIYLLSGGNSALVELPESDITLDDFQKATSIMLQGGIPIESMNCVRKHLSQIKGGKLGSYTKAKGIILVLSDVVGDDLHTIGSAPFYYDTTTYDDAISILESSGLFEKMPLKVQQFLSAGAQGHYPETPKVPHPNISHHIIGSNRLVLSRMSDILHKSDIDTKIIQEPFNKNVGELAKDLFVFAQKHQDKRHAYLFGGESTVIVTGNGKGGRNQHLCLRFLALLDGTIDVTFLSAATDGIDGNSDAAGALIDMHSPYNVSIQHVDPLHYLDTFDSNAFFRKTGELITTGPTHNNLLDIVIMLIEPTTL